ncbi:MAG TPA: helix-turn-helix transcriptional regulator [Pseudonocardia sp.]|nr:helix-turn-helix transcriptional regulator [Pseudonocardia sp.]
MSEQRPDEDAGRAASDAWSAQMDALGGFIRAQRHLANLSLREMASLTSVSNAYLSQIERGLHQPSLKVLRSIADALNLSTEQMLAQAGWMRGGNGHRAESESGVTGAPPGRAATLDTEDAIRRDPRLSPAQREALLGVYRSFVDGSS